MILATAILSLLVLLFVALSGLYALKKMQGHHHASPAMRTEILRDSLQAIADNCPGEVGIALITDYGDTVLVNNEDKYPLMSVFKLHQAIALANDFEKKGISLDTVVKIVRKDLNPDTWSPMLKDYKEEEISIPVRKLLDYTLQQSDNNASNYLFDNFESVEDVDDFIGRIIPRESFRLAVTEEQMFRDHSLCYSNHSSPLGAAILISRLFTGRDICEEEEAFICNALIECKTGTDRIVAPLIDKEGVVVAHKTGSGFRDENGVLLAHNDVAFITLPDNRYYSLAVLVKDFHGSESEAALVISRISSLVYNYVSSSEN